MMEVFFDISIKEGFLWIVNYPECLNVSEEDDLDEMMEKIIDDIIRSQIEIIEKEHKKTGFKIVSIFEMVTYDPEEGLTTQITKAVKPYLKNLI